MIFKPRLTRPEAGNPYYNTKGNGGYSNAIKGKPTDPGCDVLSNCVGYAYGRFNEIGGYGCCKHLVPTNAENFIQHRGGLSVGQAPKLGACMVWRKGGTLSGSDGAGHVAIVEEIIGDTEIVTSESGWGSSTPFYTKRRKKGSDGRWGQGSAYTFLGFIYNPAVPDSDTITKEDKDMTLPVLRKGSNGKTARALQALLIGYGFSCGKHGADGSYGPATLEAVKAYQKAKGLAVDGVCGPKTWAALLGLST